MGKRQPLGEMARRFVGRLAVERHHRSGHARHPTQVRPPPIADGHHFDMVRPPANAFFKTVNSHVKRSEKLKRGDGWRSYSLLKSDQAKRRAKAHQQRATGREVAGSRERNFCVIRFSTGFARGIHSFSTP